MNLNPPRVIRQWVYIVTAVLAPVVAYLNAKGYIGDLEVALWSAEVTVASLLAGINANTPKPPPE